MLPLAFPSALDVAPLNRDRRILRIIRQFITAVAQNGVLERDQYWEERKAATSDRVSRCRCLVVNERTVVDVTVAGLVRCKVQSTPVATGISNE